MKKQLLLIGLLFCSVPFLAQRLGLQGGYALTNADPAVAAANAVTFKKTPTSGFTIGPIFAWNFHKHFGADIAVMANMRGASFKINQQNVSDTAIIYKRTLYYLNIPLHAYYRQAVKNVEFTIFLGPSFNVGLGGSDYSYLDLQNKRPMSDTSKNKINIFGKDNRLKTFEIAAELGVGVEYKNILFRASYQYGLNNLSNNAGHPYGLETVGSGIKETYRQGLFSLTVGYVFDFARNKDRTYVK